MGTYTRRPTAMLLGLALLLGLQATTTVSGQEGFRFRSGVELINVTATVVDRTGRFLPGLGKDDFVVYEDNQPVEITHFSAERTPVSLGIVLDTRGAEVARGPGCDRSVPAAAVGPGRRLLLVSLQRQSRPRAGLDR